MRPRGEDESFYLLPGKVFEPVWAQKSDRGEFRAPSSELPKLPAGTNAELRGNLIPTLVTLVDLNDPKTVRVVQPDDFEQTFGKGVKLRDVKIEIVPAGTWPLTVLGLTGEPLTHVIEAKLSKIIPQPREQARVMQVQKTGDAYTARLGHFIIE